MSLSWRCWWPHVWPGGVGPLRLPGQHHHNTPGPPTAQAATVVCPIPVFQWGTKQTLFLKQVNGNHKNLSGFPCSLALKVFYPIRISTCTTSALALKATLKNPSALPLREAFIKNYGIFHNRSDLPLYLAKINFEKWYFLWVLKYIYDPFLFCIFFSILKVSLVLFKQRQTFKILGILL